MAGFGVFKIKNEVKFMQNNQKLYKNGAAFKRLSEKM